MKLTSVSNMRYPRQIPATNCRATKTLVPVIESRGILRNASPPLGPALMEVSVDLITIPPPDNSPIDSAHYAQIVQISDSGMGGL